jgi:hypothetical protein
MNSLNNNKIFVALFNATIAIFCLFFKDNFTILKILALFSISLFLFLCFLFKYNIFFFARTFILGLIGYFPILIKILYGRDFLFSSYEPSTQGLDIVLIMYLTTSFALLSNSMGIVLGTSKIISINNASLFTGYWKIGYYLSIPIVIITAYLFTKSFGESILVSGYGSSELKQDASFGSINSFGISALYIIFIAGLKGYVEKWKIFFCILFFYFVVYAQLLHGGRQDAMTPIFGLFVIAGIVNQKEIKLNLKYAPILFFVYLFFEAWGLLRANIKDFSFSFFIELLPSMFNNTDVIRFGTVSPISTTFANTVWLIENKYINYSYGFSYFEYLLRTPPEFLYPNRPIDYAWIFDKYDLKTGGGFFELAEVYMNFGIIGALFIPGFISYLMAKTYYYAINRQSLFSYCLLFSFLSIFLRGSWYQTFAFYRAFLVGIFLYSIILVCYTLLKNNNIKNIPKIKLYE